LDDCLGIIQAIVWHGWWHETINGVYPLHPKKKEYYPGEARKRGLKPPIYIRESGKIGKIVSPYTLLNVKNYRFMTTIVG
jgi:hypothetical protein